MSKQAVGSASPTVLGLNVGHDGGCALITRGEVAVAVAEERLNRQKYSPGWWSSLHYCLDAASVHLDDVDRVVISTGGPDLPAGFTGGLGRFGFDRRRISVVDHHMSHAIGSFCMSGFDEAAVLVCDALGNNSDTESYFVATRNSMAKVGGNEPLRPTCQGIGFTYEAFTNLLGFSDQESGKTMALAAFGDPEFLSRPLFDWNAGRVTGSLTENHQWGAQEFLRTSGVPVEGLLTDHAGELAQSVAAYVQRQCETALLNLVEHVVHVTRQRQLCLSGGVGLNCVANSRMRERFPELELFFLPPASDTGQALGNALYGFWELTGEYLDIRAGGCFLGREYDDDAIIQAMRRIPGSTAYGRLPRSKFDYHREGDICATAAELIADGNIIGWFQGRSELGPRALGNRSILADPRDARMHDLVNRRIKHREWFRPFAPSIQRDAASRFVDTAVDLPYMLESPAILDSARPLIPAALHVDGTARVQTVAPGQERFSKLIDGIAKLTGVPAVLNTSFNDREPIVETPGDALACFLASELDYLAIGDFLVSKLSTDDSRRSDLTTRLAGA